MGGRGSAGVHDRAGGRGLPGRDRALTSWYRRLTRAGGDAATWLAWVVDRHPVVTYAACLLPPLVLAHLGLPELAVVLLFPGVLIGALLRRHGAPIPRVWIPFAMLCLPLVLGWREIGTGPADAWAVTLALALGSWFVIHAGYATTFRQRVDAALVAVPAIAMIVMAPELLSEVGWTAVGLAAVVGFVVRFLAAGWWRAGTILVGAALAAVNVASIVDTLPVLPARTTAVVVGVWGSSGLVVTITGTLGLVLVVRAASVLAATGPRLAARGEEARKRWIVRVQRHRAPLACAGVLALPVMWYFDAGYRISSGSELGSHRFLSASASNLLRIVSMCLVAWFGCVTPAPRSSFGRAGSLALACAGLFTVSWLLGPGPSAALDSLVLVAALVAPTLLVPRALGEGLPLVAIIVCFLHGCAYLNDVPWFAGILLLGIALRAAVLSDVPFGLVATALVAGDFAWLMAKFVQGPAETMPWAEPRGVVDWWTGQFGPREVGLVVAWPVVLAARALASATVVPKEHPIYADFGGPQLPPDDAPDVSPGGSARSGSTSPA